MKEQQHPTEIHPHFPSGEWEGLYGYFNYNLTDKMQFELEFSDGQVKGSGHDSVGSFSWTGSYDVNTGECQITKSYLGAHTVIYEGQADESGIKGNWKIGGSGFGEGTFHLWPKAQEEEAIEKAVKKLIKEVNASIKQEELAEVK
ncbi:MAG: hypothetical protein AAGI23_05120 [Bacteroidota bacterium]